MSSARSRTIRVGALTRVEGEGALHVEMRDGVPEVVELNIYEPPRFFEAFLRGRAYTEPPDITARICGICPVAYQVSACNAIEQACGVTLDPELIALRRLLYCGEWIHSHALHIYMLHAPDFLGAPDVIAVARDPREAVTVIQSRGIRVCGCFLLGLDSQTPDVFDAIYKFVEDTAMFEVQITFLTPFPGTPLYDRLRREGRLLEETAWDRCSLFDINFQPRHMTVDQLATGYARLAERVFDPEFTRQRRHRAVHSRVHRTLD